MKKQLAKIEKFVTEHEREIEKYTWYGLGCAVGIFIANYNNKKSYDHFAARQPQHDFILKDKQGHFYGFDDINKKE